MSITSVRSALAVALAATGIDRVYAEDPESIEPPCFVLGNPPSGSYDDDFDGDMTFVLPAVLIVGRAQGIDRAVQSIDRFVEPTGSSSVRAAVRSDPTLGGVCASASVTGWRDYGGYAWNEVDYVGVTFDVEVLT